MKRFFVDEVGVHGFRCAGVEDGDCCCFGLIHKCLAQFLSSCYCGRSGNFCHAALDLSILALFLRQLQTNILGAALALLAGIFFSNNVIAIGIVCIIVIIISLRMGMEETIGLTLVTVVAVMEASGEWRFAVNRLLLSLIGIGCAFVVNVLFFPPKPKEQFAAQIRTIFGKMSLLLRTVISNEMKETVFREEKEGLRSGLKSLSDKYRLMEEEIKKIKGSGFKPHS